LESFRTFENLELDCRGQTPYIEVFFTLGKGLEV